MRRPPLLHRAFVVALLGWSPVALAQQPVARLRREQQLVLPGKHAASELELKVASRNITVVRFDEDVDIVEVKQEGLGGVVWVDVGAHSLLLEPRRELASGERLSLEVVLAQGMHRVRLVLVLVSHPNEIDREVNLELQPRSARSPSPQGPPRATASWQQEDWLAHLILSGAMKEKSIIAAAFAGKAVGTGVIAEDVWSYRAEGMRAIAFQVHNPQGARQWSASEVVPLSASGTPVPSNEHWTVHMVAPSTPGSSAQVVVVGPAKQSDSPLRLQVREKDGSRHVLLEGH